MIHGGQINPVKAVCRNSWITGPFSGYSQIATQSANVDESSTMTVTVTSIHSPLHRHVRSHTHTQTHPQKSTCARTHALTCVYNAHEKMQKFHLRKCQLDYIRLRGRARARAAGQKAAQDAHLRHCCERDWGWAW